MARRQRYITSAVVEPDGTAAATFTAPNGTLHVYQTRVTVTTDVSQPTATLYINGAEFDGSYTGANDTSDSAYDLESGDQLECRWVGADVGATATLYVWAQQED